LSCGAGQNVINCATPIPDTIRSNKSINLAISVPVTIIHDSSRQSSSGQLQYHLSKIQEMKKEGRVGLFPSDGESITH
jgi:hypothetical protein